MRPRLICLATAAAVLPLSSIALAADPEGGKISAATPKLAWKGSLTAPYGVWLQWFQNSGQGECTDPACDSFALEVADGPANITLKLAVSSPDASQKSFRVVKPNGSITYFNVATADEAKLVLKNAENGKYSVDVSSGSKTQATYEASAERAGGPGSPSDNPNSPPPPLTTPPPSPGTTEPGSGQTGQPGQGQQPVAPSGPAEDFKLTFKAPKIKARKARKGAKVKVGVTVSREVQSLTATLKKGKKKVGAGKLGRFNGSRTVSLKLSKKLKKGRYALTVAARDARGVVVSRTVLVKVAR